MFYHCAYTCSGEFCENAAHGRGFAYFLYPDSEHDDQFDGDDAYEGDSNVVDGIISGNGGLYVEYVGDWKYGVRDGWGECTYYRYWYEHSDDVTAGTSVMINIDQGEVQENSDTVSN